MQWQEAVERIRGEAGSKAAFAADGQGVMSYFDDPDFCGFVVSDGEIYITSRAIEGVPYALEELDIPQAQSWRVC